MSLKDLLERILPVELELLSETALFLTYTILVFSLVQRLLVVIFGPETLGLTPQSLIIIETIIVLGSLGPFIPLEGIFLAASIVLLAVSALFVYFIDSRELRFVEKIKRLRFLGAYLSLYTGLWIYTTLYDLTVSRFGSTIDADVVVTLFEFNLLSVMLTLLGLSIALLFLSPILVSDKSRIVKMISARAYIFAISVVSSIIGFGEFGALILIPLISVLMIIEFIISLLRIRLK